MAAAPSLVLSGSYALALYWPDFYPEKPRMLYVSMQVEFLVIHSFAFLGMVAAARPETWIGRIIRQLVFWGLMALYLGFAYQGGVEGVILFLSLTGVTYLGLLLNLTSRLAVAELATRWFYLFMSSIVIWGLNGLPENVASWGRAEETLHAGFWYFGFLGIVEILGVFRSPALTGFYREVASD